jgi:hypothetical protein
MQQYTAKAVSCAVVLFEKKVGVRPWGIPTKVIAEKKKSRKITTD